MNLIVNEFSHTVHENNFALTCIYLAKNKTLICDYQVVVVFDVYLSKVSFPADLAVRLKLRRFCVFNICKKVSFPADLAVRLKLHYFCVDNIYKKVSFPVDLAVRLKLHGFLFYNICKKVSFPADLAVPLKRGKLLVYNIYRKVCTGLRRSPLAR